MTTSSPTAPHLKSKEATIEGIQHGLADIKVGRMVGHEVATTSLRKIIDAEECGPRKALQKRPFLGYRFMRHATIKL